ncbi:MAG: Crp/Fnr family transcriptional regulator [Tissierellia bacterium]|nr:Crp/Fnr family transcriptional regulator [Tissierellia bacterium]MDD3226040.1 Crp/Fnr family transcriptional regulator [Tissierellia bacterium]MDD3751619.1 Crp/Fnr family transcriptional regulator [Tissierellia bacterium]MDD4045753.1 Crp/Fnr family transcriptional regulator [Tissierellia bacterium]MDD4678065.1 Crp/Fnr family transcriptional regulator [Tissierellia bacterium]
MEKCNCCSHDCGHGYCIDNVAIFVDLPIEIKQSIMDSSNHKIYKKGEIIFNSGDYFDYFFIVNKGRVKLSKISAMGKEQILKILEVGDFMGELSLFKDTLLTNSAEALEKTEICIIRSEKVREIIMQRPEIALKFLEKYAERIKHSEELIEQIGLRDVEQRIANYLIAEVEKNNIKNRNNEYEINLPVTKSVLSSILGTTKETLSRKLSLLQDEGLIRLEGQRKIIITDIENLRDMQ